MAVPTGTRRFNITASIAGGEIMVHTLHAASSAEDLQVATNRMVTAWSDMITTAVGGDAPQQNLANTTIYQSVDAYVLDSAGHATQQATAQFPAGTIAGVSNSILPNEVAMCLSLITAVPGRTARGRLFMGGLAASTLTSAGRFKPGVCDTFAHSFAGFVYGLSAPGPGGIVLAVLSKTAGRLNNITSVKVGDVPDVQRRRRNRLFESYSSRPVAA